jgi:hypothetical protein
MDDKAPRSKVISMNEDIGTLIRRGFETWRGNLNLAVPFVLMIVAIMVLAWPWSCRDVSVDHPIPNPITRGSRKPESL